MENHGSPGPGGRLVSWPIPTAPGVIRLSPEQARRLAVTGQPLDAGRPAGVPDAVARLTARAAQSGQLNTYGTVTVSGTKPRRSRIGRLLSDASTCRYRYPRATASRARVATSAR